MAGGYTLSMAADTSSFERAISKGIIDPLEETEKGLHALEKSKAGDSLEGEMRQAQRSTEDLRDDIKRLQSSVQDAGKKGGRALSDGMKEGARDARQEVKLAGEGVQGFKDEAVANFSEVASSFSGDMSQAADGVQGLLGGLASSLGPAGILLAAAGAVGGAFLNSWQDSADKIEERVGTMYDDMAASGMEFLTKEFQNQAIKDLLGDKDKYAKLTEQAKILGLSEAELARATVASGADRDAVFERAAVLSAAAIENSKDQGRNAQIVAQRQLIDYKNITAAFGGYNDEQAKALDKAHVYRAAIADTTGTIDQARAALDNLNSSANVPKDVKLRLDMSQAELDLDNFIRSRRADIQIGVRYSNGKAVLQ